MSDMQLALSALLNNKYTAKRVVHHTPGNLFKEYLFSVFHSLPHHTF